VIPEPSVHPYVPLRFEDFDREVEMHQSRVKEYCKLRAPEPPEPSDIVVVTELGYKTRIVTRNDAYRVARAHKVRAALYPSVVCHRGCKESLAATPQTLELPLMKKDIERLVFSADLRKATDLMGHEWLYKVCDKLHLPYDTILEGFEIDDDEENILVLRGVFMGMPVSWTLLEFTHMLICNEIDPHGAWFIKGDDLIAYWTKYMIEKYQFLIKIVGFEINIPKSYISKTAGTFCEGYYVVTNTENRRYLQLIPTMSLRGLVQQKPGPLFPDLRIWMEETIARGVSRDLVWKVVTQSRQGAFKHAQKRGISFCLPECLGGLQLPSPNPKEEVNQKVAGLVWGNLEKDLHGPYKPLLTKGPNSKSLASLSKKIQYRSGVDSLVECPHWERVEEFMLMRASYRDLPFGKRSLKPDSMLSYLNHLYRCKRKAKRNFAWNARIVSWETVSRLYRELKPTPSSIQEVYPHPCRNDEEDDTTSTV
jgi:hypothetical protein